MLWPKDSTWCRKTSVALAAIQACYVNSDVTYSLGKKWTWNLWCSKERSGEEFVSRCGEDGNILETEAGVGVLMCTWLEALQTPSPRDYPNLVMTSIIRWAKSFGSNSYRVRELSQRWKPGHSKETYRAPSLIYPQWVEWRQWVECTRRQWCSWRLEDSFVHAKWAGMSLEPFPGWGSVVEESEASKVCLNVPALKTSFCEILRSIDITYFIIIRSKINHHN